MPLTPSSTMPSSNEDIESYCFIFERKIINWSVMCRWMQKTSFRPINERWVPASGGNCILHGRVFMICAQRALGSICRNIIKRIFAAKSVHISLTDSYQQDRFCYQNNSAQSNGNSTADTWRFKIIEDRDKATQTAFSDFCSNLALRILYLAAFIFGTLPGLFSNVVLISVLYTQDMGCSFHIHHSCHWFHTLAAMKEKSSLKALLKL